jgi:hypothetical protein
VKRLEDLVRLARRSRGVPKTARPLSGKPA